MVLIFNVDKQGANCPSKTTLLFSNVKGPQEEISFYGHPIAFVAPSCYGQTNVKYPPNFRFLYRH